ncbi:alpha/beta-hydrolase [Microthyrium microscopicum]|uniref:Alpha/beta-hydrolase n=1 Tax=Microthyrium microscopicum TaxID=703497 RepID=A0A6A6URH8_9PEZI|nr:alpha/beta-hydrolase [Microthyrium microscopicum]
MYLLRWLLALSALLTPALTQNTTNSSAPVIYPITSDPEMSFQLQVLLGYADGEGANSGEILRAASQLIPQNFESFYSAFYYLAAKIQSIATSTNATKFPVSARQAYFRAATYYRAADFFLHGNITDPRIYSLWASALSNFDAAIKLLPIPAARVNLTSSDGSYTVPAIFYPASATNSSKLPTIVAGTGYDGSQEELYHAIGKSLLERGYNFMTYEGPGQPTVRRYQNIGFRPDWWTAVTPVVDWLEKRSDVDTTKLALVGISYGGVLAPIAATKEKRFKAVMAIDGVVSLYDSLIAQFPSSLTALFKSGNATAFDAVVNAASFNTSTPSTFRWGVQQGMFAFNTTSPFDWVTRTKAINVTAESVKNIDVPVFVGDGEDDSSFSGQAKIVAGYLGDRAYYYEFTNALGAGQHCQVGAEYQLAAVMGEWLDGVFSGAKLLANGTVV